jgi:hypothetical protein
MKIKVTSLVLVGFIGISLVGLAGCDTKIALSTKKNIQRNTTLNRPVIPRVKGTDGRQYADLATSIPKNAEYLKVKFVVNANQKSVGVMIGHQLTTQGAGIQDHGPIFYPKGNRVTVYIPMGVVFEMIPNADLFAYFPKVSTSIPHHPTSVWLLMYGGNVNNYVMTEGTMTTKDLGSSNVTQNQVKHDLAQAEKNGWHIAQTVNMQKDLTGFLGKNGWAKLPIGVPVNLIQSDGNDIFEIQGIVSQTQLLKEHPELKAGIEAASAPAR